MTRPVPASVERTLGKANRLAHRLVRRVESSAYQDRRVLDGLENARGCGLQAEVTRLTHFDGQVHCAGWALHPDSPVVSVTALLPERRPRLVRSWRHNSTEDERSTTGRINFELRLREPDHDRAAQLKLLFKLKDGRKLMLDDLAYEHAVAQPAHQLMISFFDSLKAMGSGRVLEIGSRNRSGNVRSDLVPGAMDYVGFDILAGENVDVIGDAHQLSRLLPAASFDAVFSFSTFEHLLMPWKVAVEINRVTKIGALVHVHTHQTFPMHELPWDFWRYSPNAWQGLFNERTGFEILETATGLPASVVPQVINSVVSDLPREPAMLTSAVLCRKVGEAQVDWDVDSSSVLRDHYPSG